MASPALERRITALDKPLIALAGVAVLIYLCELFRLFPHGSRPVLVWANFLIDTVFLCDLVAKIIILGRSYLRSPWFLIDLISTLPVVSSTIELLEVLGPQVQFLSAVRVTRVARVGRTSRLANIARVARIARALRVARGLVFLKSLPSELQQTPTFNRALKIGVPLLLVAFVAIAYYVQHIELGRLERDLRQRVAAAHSVENLTLLPEYLGHAADVAQRHVRGPRLTVERLFRGERVAVVFSLDRAIVVADRMQGLLLVLVLLTVIGVVYIASSLSHDRRRATELALLGQCFSPPIVDKFFASPDVLQRYFEQWMSVFFIDVRGFTAATQQQHDDLEGLALRLRRVMDIARDEIVVTHQGVVDKFMGDAVMGWFGGHFSHHWNRLAPLRRELLLDQIEEAASNVLTLEREQRDIEAGSRPANADALQRERDAVKAALEESRAQLAELRRQQEAVRAAQPELDSRFEEASESYRRAVASAAVRCLLRIVDQVGAQQEANAFREVKVGMASGPICVGNFGSTQQVGFTILGPTVNRAARLEPASFQCGCKALVDEETYKLVSDDEEIVFRSWGRLEVKGIEGDLAVYEPLWAGPETRRLLELFHEGRGRAERGELEAALASFTQADESRQGGDPASRLWRDRVQRALGEGSRAVGVYHATKG
jgi:class 3 adenylate cyclase